MNGFRSRCSTSRSARGDQLERKFRITARSGGAPRRSARRTTRTRDGRPDARRGPGRRVLRAARRRRRRAPPRAGGRLARGRRRGSATLSGRSREGRIACTRRAPSLADDADLAEDVQVALRARLRGGARATPRGARAPGSRRSPPSGALVRRALRQATRVGVSRREPRVPSSSTRGSASSPRGSEQDAKPVPPPSPLIRPARRSGLPDFRELWRSRDLAMILAWRDVKVRYKQSLIGIAWAVLQPFLTMVVFTLIFGKFAQLPSQGAAVSGVRDAQPRPVDVPGGSLHPHRRAASSATGCSSRRCTSRCLILPLACILVPLVDFAFSFTVALGITSWYDVAIQATIVLVPLFLLMLAMTAIGLGLVPRGDQRPLPRRSLRRSRSSSSSGSSPRASSTRRPRSPRSTWRSRR